jgi:hypothetical protein
MPPGLWLENVVVWKGEHVKAGKARLRNAVSAVLKALGSGELRATGLPNGIGDRQEIAKWLWADLELLLLECRARTLCRYRWNVLVRSQVFICRSSVPVAGQTHRDQ